MTLHFSKHLHYLEIIAEQLAAAEHAAYLQSARDSMADWLKHSDEENRCCTVCIVFSAFAVEAYINDVSKAYIGGGMCEAVDRLPTAMKWVIVPKLAFPDKPTIQTGDNLYRRLKQLSEMRDELAHSKPLVIAEDSPPDKTQWRLSDKAMQRLSEYLSRSLSQAQEAAGTCRAALAWMQPLLPDDRFRVPEQHLTGGHRIADSWPRLATGANAAAQPERPRMFLADSDNGPPSGETQSAKRAWDRKHR